MSELRQDLVSGDWVLLAPGRAKRPNFLREKKKPRTPSPKRGCPFEDLVAGGEWPPIFAYPSADPSAWKFAVVPNKYPAISRGGRDLRSEPFRRGIYHLRTAVGTAWLLITRDHNAHFAELSSSDAARVFEMFREAHDVSANDPAAAYVSSFYNYGPSAGASIWHPHYQILTLPVIPSHTEHSLAGARAYWRAHGRCVRCDILKTERRARTRIVDENAHAVALVPFAAKHPMEVMVLPKRHWDSLRDTPPAALAGVASLVQSVLRKLKSRANDPDLNFFVHDTPLGPRDYRFHHWHVEIIPRLTIDAGFEFSTNIAINVMDPDDAAAILRGEQPHSHAHL